MKWQQLWTYIEARFSSKERAGRIYCKKYGHSWDGDVCSMCDSRKPITPPTSDPQPEPSTGCNCDTSKPWQVPPYTAEQLAAGGNAEECPVPFPGKDIRAHIRSPNGTFWLIGSLFDQGIASDLPNGYWCGNCINADNGRYHFIGWSTRSEESSLVRTAAKTPIKYNGTVFGWWEYRGGANPQPQPQPEPQPAPHPDNGNVPPFYVENGNLMLDGKNVEVFASPRPDGTRTPSAGEFHGSVDLSKPGSMTRYALLGVMQEIYGVKCKQNGLEHGFQCGSRDGKTTWGVKP